MWWFCGLDVSGLHCTGEVMRLTSLPPSYHCHPWCERSAFTGQSKEKGVSTEDEGANAVPFKNFSLVHLALVSSDRGCRRAKDGENEASSRLLAARRLQIPKRRKERPSSIPDARETKRPRKQHGRIQRRMVGGFACLLF